MMSKRGKSVQLEIEIKRKGPSWKKNSGKSVVIIIETHSYNPNEVYINESLMKYIIM